MIAEVIPGVGYVPKLPEVLNQIEDGYSNYRASGGLLDIEYYTLALRTLARPRQFDLKYPPPGFLQAKVMARCTGISFTAGQVTAYIMLQQGNPIRKGNKIDRLTIDVAEQSEGEKPMSDQMIMGEVILISDPDTYPEFTRNYPNIFGDNNKGASKP